MSESPLSNPALSVSERAEQISALFAGLVVQNTNMALVLMGQVPHPETGERTQDLDGAQFFIDQLEMLAVKTKGNLDKREDQLLQQNLTALRMAFVQSLDEKGTAASAAGTSASGSTAPSTPTSAPAQPNITAPPPESEEESRKKFTKK